MKLISSVTLVRISLCFPRAEEKANPKDIAYTSPAGVRKHDIHWLLLGSSGYVSFGQKNSVVEW